jgi:hypothetical protein
MLIAKVKVALAAGLAICVGADRAMGQAPGAPAQNPAPRAIGGGAGGAAPAAAPVARPGVMIAPINFRMGGVAIPVQEADVVVIGKVGKFEEKEQVEHRIAVIKVEEAIKGAKGLTSVRVGAPATEKNDNNLNNLPQIQLRPIGGGGPFAAAIARFPIERPTITEGAEGVFFLKKHAKGDFYVLVSATTATLPKTQPNYDEQVKLVREVAKFLETPVEKSLKADKAEDRFLAAGLLIMKYRTRTDSKPMKEEAIDAEESKQIMKVLSESDYFTKPEPRLGMTALDLFNRLGVTAKDGWQPPQPKIGPRVPLPVPPAPPGAPGRNQVQPAPAPAPVEFSDKPAKADDKNAKPAPAVPAKPVAPPQIKVIGGGGATIIRPMANGPYIDSVKAWLKKNQETYRIKRFVEESK